MGLCSLAGLRYETKHSFRLYIGFDATALSGASHVLTHMYQLCVCPTQHSTALIAHAVQQGKEGVSLTMRTVLSAWLIT